MKTLGQVGEFSLIARLAAIAAAPADGVLTGIGDDAAVLRIDRTRRGLFTTDMLIENVHFTRAQPAAAVGHKLLACSLSDIAAMGGVPRYAVISVGAPPDMPLDYMLRLYRGMRRTARAFDTAIVGGDVSRSECLVLNAAVWGECRARQLTLRGGARPGDWLLLTGTLGSGQPRGHLTFVPRVREAQFLVNTAAVHAMIDISDGLLQDIHHIAAASGVQVIIEPELVPRPTGVTVEQALTGGEDFELALAVSPAAGRRLLRCWPFRSPALTRIGECRPGRGLLLRRPDGSLQPRAPGGFDHFRHE